MNKFQKAFTLIELLIVIAIIAILTVAFLPGALKAPARARDTARIKKIHDIQAVLDVYGAQSFNFPDSSAGYPNCFLDTIAATLNIDPVKDPSSLNSCNNSSSSYKDKFLYVGKTMWNFYIVGVRVENWQSGNSDKEYNEIIAVTTKDGAKALISSASLTSSATNPYYLVVGP